MIQTKNIRSSYIWFNKTYQKKGAIHRDKYARIVNGYIQHILDKVFEGNFVQLSGGDSLGTIGIVGKKQEAKVGEDGRIRGLAPDWGATKKLWATNPQAKEAKTVLYHFNEHSDNIRYNLVWRTALMKLPNKMFYSFTFHRRVRRRVAPAVRAGVEYYVKPKRLENVQV